METVFISHLRIKLLVYLTTSKAISPVSSGTAIYYSYLL